MARAEREPPAESRGKPPSPTESFTTFGRPTEAITFMSFAIFCKLGTPNLGYTISRQDLKNLTFGRYSVCYLTSNIPLHYTANIEELILAIYNN